MANPNFSQDGNPGGGLLDLALADTGTLVDLNLIQITDKTWFLKFNEHLLHAVASILEEKPQPNLQEMGIPAKGWLQEDGRLVVHFKLRTDSLRVLELPPGTWRIVDERELGAVAEKLLQGNNTEKLTEAMNVLSGQICKQAAMQRDKREEMLEMANELSQLLTVYDKHPTSLHALRSNIDDNPNLKLLVDRWLGLEHQLLVISQGYAMEMHWACPVADMNELLVSVIPDIATNRVQNISQVIMVAAWLDESLQAPIMNLWERLGGKIPP